MKQKKLVKDIIELVGRTTQGQNVKHLFLKLESSSAAYLHMLREIFPDAKWTFSYRNAEEILERSMQHKRNGTCMKAKRNPTTALATKSTSNNLDLESLSHHQVCALHLSTLLESAIEEHEDSGTGLIVSYDDIASGSIIQDVVLPYLGLQVEDQKTKDRITEILAMRSNSRGSSTSQKGQWDVSQEDGIEITDETRNAVKMFMGGLMESVTRK